MNTNKYTIASKLSEEQKDIIVRAINDIKFASGYVEPIIIESDDEALIDTVHLIQQEASDLINFIKSGVELTGMTLVMFNNSMNMLKRDFGKVRSYLYKIHSKHAEGCLFRSANLDEAFSLDRNC